MALATIDGQEKNPQRALFSTDKEIQLSTMPKPHPRKGCGDRQFPVVAGPFKALSERSANESVSIRCDRCVPGSVIPAGLAIDGLVPTAAKDLRAASGLIQVFTILAVLDFTARLVTGLSTSNPFGILGARLVRKRRPEWVGAKQKPFAWSLGLIMANVVAYLVNTGQNGDLPSALCIVCIALMWMEASLGICVGCKLFDALIRLRLVARPANKPACPGGSCSLTAVDSAM